MKAEIKTKSASLETKTKDIIENLSDEQASELLKAKWIIPLIQNIMQLPDRIIKELVANIELLEKKYETTFEEIENEITETEKVISRMIDELEGSESDMLGLKELKNCWEVYKMTKENGKPQIRFAKFKDTWEQRKLGNVLVSLQNNTLSRADLSNESGVAKNVHYGDVLIKVGEVLDVGKEQLPMILDESVLTKYKASFLQNGDVIVADTAEDSTVGKCSEIAGLNDEIVLSGLHTIPYRPVENFASGYLGYYLNSDTYHNQLLPLMQGIKVTSISKSAMQDTDIFYPKSIEEQGKISNYLQALDHLITLHQRKFLYIIRYKFAFQLNVKKA